MAEIREIASGLGFPEGPVWMPDGTVLVTEIRRGTITRVRPDGRTEVVANTGGGPNGAAVGPDGALYVGQFGGEGTPDGQASVIRVADDGTTSVYATGFTAITGVAFGPDGSLYVSQLVRDSAAFQSDLMGAVYRVKPDGTRSELAPGKLQAAGGVAVDANGRVYVSINSVSAGRGAVVRIG